MWAKIGIRIAGTNLRQKGEENPYVIEPVKGDRKSTALKFPHFGDYNISKGMKLECLAVLEELSEERVPIEKSFVKKCAGDSSKLTTKGNNTVSMLIAIGALKEINDNNCIITSIGIRLKEHPDQWNKVVVNQALIFKAKNGIRPYRLILKALLNHKGRINYPEFLFGISQIEVIGELPNYAKMDGTIKYLRAEYPSGLSQMPRGKHANIIAKINKCDIGLNIEAKDIWSTKTTQWNKWRSYIQSCFNILPFTEVSKYEIKILDKKSIASLKLALSDSEKALSEEYGSDAATWWHELNDDDDDWDLDN
jgi:hypothetical protein